MRRARNSIENLAGRFRIQSRGGFVEKHVARLHRQRSRDRQTLLPPESSRVEGVKLFAETYMLELLFRHPSAFALAHVFTKRGASATSSNVVGWENESTAGRPCRFSDEACSDLCPCHGDGAVDSERLPSCMSRECRRPDNHLAVLEPRTLRSMGQRTDVGVSLDGGTGSPDLKRLSGLLRKAEIR